MNGKLLRAAGYRFRTTFRRRWGAYLSLMLLTGIIGGVAMASIAGARRTQSSFPVYLASTNPSDVQLFTEFAPITNIGYSPKLDQAIARVPNVKHAADVIGFDGNLQILGPNQGTSTAGEAPPAFEGSTNGDYLTQDRMTLVRGRILDSSSSNEMDMSQGGASLLGLQIGSSLPIAFFTDAQDASPNFSGYPTDKPYLIERLKLVGIVKASDQIVQDDDAVLQDQFAVLSPKLTGQLATCCAYYSYVGLQIEGGQRNEASVASAVKKLLPSLGPAGTMQTAAPVVAKAERAIRPESIAFGVFGVLAMVAALIICAQVGSRMLRRDSEERSVLRALGAGPAMTMADGLLGILGAIVGGAILAVVIAVALSPLAPLGAVRPVYPDPGVAFDWTVLGFGFLLLVLALSSAATFMAYRLRPDRVRATDGAQLSGLSSAVASSGLPPSALTGLRSAIGTTTASDKAPVRSAILGAVLAVVVIVASITFAASLNTLVSRPALYGWNWNYTLLSGFSGEEDLPAHETGSLLAADPAIAHWSGVWSVGVRLDGTGVPALVTSPGASVSPPLLSGHGLESSGQVVVGSDTLASLHMRVGDTVVASVPGARPVRLRIVGTATFPAIKGSGASFEMGTGAIVSPKLYPESDLNEQQSAIPGPNAVLISIKRGVSPSVALRSLDRIVNTLSQSSDPDSPIGGVVSALRPAEIADYQTVGSTPTILAAVLGGGAVSALGLTLVSSVRRRRREFALLKALGLTQRQIAASVAWQSSVSAIIGVIFGVPIGVALGRWLWTLFARGISAVPYPTVPVLSVVLVAIGALLFAVVVASFPGRIAARTPTAVLLSAE